MHEKSAFLKISLACTHSTGYFVVDLDKLTKDNIIQDKKIKPSPFRLTMPTCRPSKSTQTKSLKDYNTIEKELRNRLEAKFDTAENGQKADAAALRMVKEVYEPIVKAIDARYTLEVEFE